MLKRKTAVFITALILLPNFAFALQMPTSTQDMANMANVTSGSFVVANESDGRIILAKNADAPWVPASLTKLVTALVFLDTKPDMNKVVKISVQDQKAGGCSDGGACISTKPGVAYKLKDLFYASLIASANNTTMAVARSTGLSQDEFVKRMNQKVKDLGAANTFFVEPTGMSPLNTTTASDYAKITKEAMNDPVIAKVVALSAYKFASTNNKKYAHNLKNTNKLLGDEELNIIGGKTGYLEESKYNFVSKIMNRFGNTFVVVVLGSASQGAEFRETKELATLGSLALAFSNFNNNPAVLGTSTTGSTINN